MAARLTAKLVGAGYERPNADSELPLDINYAKLGEWLVDRKQVPADYNRKLQAIQATAVEAVRELPPGFLGQFEGGEDVPLDYFLAAAVLGKLSETAEKGFLGSFKGAAGDWEKVVKAYEYNLMYVAEAAQTLARNGDFEIPFLKKQAAKAQQQLSDLERRKAEAHKSAAAAAADFQQECQQLGINSGNIRAGLLGLTAELPALVGAALESLQADPVTQALEYYAAVTAQQQEQQGSGGGAPEAGQLLAVLAEVWEGRTAPPEPAAGEPAAGAEGSGGEAGGSGTCLQVDGDLGAALEAVGGGEAGGDSAAADAAGASGISWELDAADLAAAGEQAGPAGISWDVEVAPSAELGGEGEPASADGAPAGISWDIDISGTGETEQEAAAAASASGSGARGGAPAAQAAAAAAAGEWPATVRRLVEDAAYRARLLDDIFELRAFLMQRCHELGGKSNELLVSSASEAVRHVSADVAAAMLQGVEAAVALLSGEKLKRLISLRTSPRCLDRLAAGLQQKAGQEAKFHRAAAEAEQRRSEIQRQLMADSAKLAVLVKKTRQAKEGAEAALSAKLGRRINIMGEVNQLLG
ncbi:hypothetical protein ABPG75_013882 [Micractinium tetrahymenae]